MSWVEYRVVSKREGQRPTVKRYASRAAAERRLVLLGPEPWRAYGKGPDDPCEMHEHTAWGGEDMAFDGTTERACTEKMRAEMPALEYVRLEWRVVGTWETA
jgi:hypothetical protein